MANHAPLTWQPPASFDPEKPGLGLPTLEGVEHGRTFDQTWLLMHNPRGASDDGLHKGGGPQYFQAVTVNGNIWVVYSIAKEQVGVTKVPIASLTSK